MGFVILVILVVCFFAIRALILWLNKGARKAGDLAVLAYRDPEKAKQVATDGVIHLLVKWGFIIVVVMAILALCSRR